MPTVPPIYDEWDIYEGARNEIVYLYTDSSGNAVDLSSYTAACNIKTLDLATTHLALSTVANGNGSVITLGADGYITILITPADSTLLSFTDTDANSVPEAFVDLEITFSATNVEKQVRGKARLLRE